MSAAEEEIKKKTDESMDQTGQTTAGEGEEITEETDQADDDAVEEAGNAPQEAPPEQESGKSG